jgi:hypothetical protein
MREEVGRVLTRASRDEMILSTHAVVGGAIATQFPSHPVLVVVAGFASHFVIDAIPHWDYSLRAISLKPGANNRSMTLDGRLVTDLALIGFDASLGLALVIWLFATPATLGAIALGAVAGMAPDPLQFLQSVFPHEPLNSLQRFHRWIHSRRKLPWLTGASSQVLFAAAVAGIAIMLG